MLGALGKGQRGEEVLVTCSPTWASAVLVSLSSTGAAELQPRCGTLSSARTR